MTFKVKTKKPKKKELTKQEMIYKLKQVGYSDLSNKLKWHIKDLYDEAKSEGDF